MRKIIFFELNEVPFSVVDHFVEKYPESTLAKLLPYSIKMETVAPDEGELSPWITWPTVHRGVSNHVHQIKDFGEDLQERDKQYPPVWKILAKAGLKPGVFASMHTYPMPENYQDYAFYLPDPFAGDSAAFPPYTVPFQQFNLAMSRRSGRNVDGGIDMKAAMKLLSTLPQLGIKPTTFLAIGKQLLEERQESWKKNRRRVFQSVLAFDIFMRLMETKQPDFATFFSNHVASAMHRYWAATFPEHYSTYNLSEEWKTRFSGEIDYAMHTFDRFLARMVSFVKAHPEYTLLISSSMGQEATKAEQLSTELYAKDFNRFISYFQLAPGSCEIRPAMHPQYNLRVEDEAQAAALAGHLNQVSIDGKPLVFRQKEGGFFSINLGHRNLPSNFVSYNGSQVSFQELGLVNEAIEDESDGTAYHIPEGILLQYDPNDLSVKNKKHKGINTLAIAPSLLQNYGLPVPGYMSEERIPSLQPQHQPSS
jgi:hypothetical protein